MIVVGGVEFMICIFMGGWKFSLYFGLLDEWFENYMFMG